MIRAVGPYDPEAPDEAHPFQALAQAIAHQQLNGTAANTILRRLVESCGQGSFPSPQCVLDASTASLRAAGFSFAKVAALKDLAAKTLANVVPDHAGLVALPDEEIIVRLTQVRGIGRWTVEMLLMFRLGTSGRAAGGRLRRARGIPRRLRPAQHAAPEGAGRLGRALEAVPLGGRLVPVARPGTEARGHAAGAHRTHPPATGEEAAPRWPKTAAKPRPARARTRPARATPAR